MPKVKMNKKGILISLAILFVLVAVLGFASFFSFPDVLHKMGLTGMAIVSKICPDSFVDFGYNIDKLSMGNYELRWAISEEDDEYDAIYMGYNINQTDPNNESNNRQDYFIPAYSNNSGNYSINGTAPISRIIDMAIHVKHGILDGACKPWCVPDDWNVPEGPGAWYDLCEGTKLKDALLGCPEPYQDPDFFRVEPSQVINEICAYFTVSPPSCCFNGTANEGWYNDTNCTFIESMGCGTECRSERLIKLTQCETGEFSVYYDYIPERIAIFEQEFKLPEGAEQPTSINWFTKYDFIEDRGQGASTTSEDLMSKHDEIDYISKYDSSDQKYFGTAKGTVAGHDVYIGSFDVDNGKPYFASMGGLTPGVPFYLSYAGDMPAPVTFELEPGDNMLSLPLNTTIENVTSLCNSLGLGVEEAAIHVWDPKTQHGSVYVCGDDDTSLFGGRVYRVIINDIEPGTLWTQE